MAILVALMLIVLLTLAGIGASRNAIRELSITGDVVQGAKANASADAGLDWFQAWSYSANTGAGGVGNTIPTIMSNLQNGTLTNSAGQATTTLQSASLGGDMVMGASNSNVLQNFDIQLTFLGLLAQQTGSSGGGNHAGTGNNATTNFNLWGVTAVGRSTVQDSTGHAIMAFQNQRQALSLTPQQQQQ
jgi:Tfp pilus assembly protein PilX